MIYRTPKGNVVSISENGIATALDGRQFSFTENQIEQCELIARLDERFLKYFTEEVLKKYEQIRDGGFGDIYMLDRALNGQLDKDLNSAK